MKAWHVIFATALGLVLIAGYMAARRDEVPAPDRTAAEVYQETRWDHPSRIADPTTNRPAGASPAAAAGDSRQVAYNKCLPLQAEFRANPAKFGIISVGQPNSAQINFDYLTAAWAKEAGVDGNDVVLRMACNSALRGVSLP
jgi:hypothetical protein